MQKEQYVMMYLDREIIYHMTEQFLKILNEKQSLLLKVNSLFCLTLCVQTSQYAIIEMIEAFILPQLQEIALYQADKRTYPKTSQYFKDKGYPQSTPNIEQLGHNYVTMATNLVFLAAGIKESYYFFTDKLNVASAFKVLSNRLVQKGNEIPENIKQQAMDLQPVYQNNLFEFENYEATYVQFFKKRVSTFLLEGNRNRQALDIRKILKNNDSWLTSQIIGSLHDALQDQNFQVRRNALTLLNELFLWGDVEAIMIVNQGQSVEVIGDKILEVKGGLDLGRGALIYPQIKGQGEQKKNFYIDYLRCLELWSRLVPRAIYLNREEDSKTVKIYNMLRQKNIVFPSNDSMNKIVKQFEQNMKRNQQRNNYIITQLNDGETSKNRSVASNRLSKYSQKISLIRQMRQSTILTLSQIQKMIQDTQVALRILCKNERQLSKNMKILNYFSQEFQKKFCLIQQSVTQQHLQIQYERGCKCLQKIEQIDPYYSDYINGKIDFKRFSQFLQNKFSQIENNKSKSKFSDVLSKLSKSKNSFSKDGLELSKSLHNTKNRQNQYQKQDHILQKSIDKSKLLHSQSNFIQPIQPPTNHSQLSEHRSKISKAGRSNLQENGEIVLKNKKPDSIISNSNSSKNMSKLSKQDHKNSISFQKEESVRSTEKDLKPTAKFILEKQQDKIESEISNKSSLKKQKQSNGSSLRANYYNKNTPEYHQLTSRKKQQFSDNSQWSQSDEQKVKVQIKQRPKVQKSINSNHTNENKSKNKNKSKSREVFSDTSFSQYDDSNQQIRQEIDKTQNPDFKLLFKEKTFQQNPSQNSKMSKLSKLQSPQHYAAVLESLVPRPSNPIQKSVSKIDKDKSTSQLPPKSFYENDSKFDQKNYEIPSEYQYSKQSQSFKQKMPTKTIINKSKNSNQSQGSKQFSSKEKSPSNINLNKQDSNSMYPPGKQDKSSSKSSRQQLLSPPSSLIHEQYQIPVQQNVNSSKMSSLSSNQKNGSKYSNYKSGQKQKKSIEKSLVRQSSKIQNSEIKLQNLKILKLKEIQQLQKRIKSLKDEQKQLFTIRSDWQSPTRPNTIRTAISPRFRDNNNNTNQSNPSNSSSQQFEFVSKENVFYRQKGVNQRKRVEQMNFDVTQLFKPPIGRLIYSRLYRKDLLQLDMKERRKILKGKDLVYRNQQIQIGLMIHRDQKDLKIIYYITPSRFIKTFLFKIEGNNKLSVHAIPNEISNLEPKKQYRIYLFAEVLEFPYKMPKIQFKYHPQLMTIEQKLFINNEVNYFTSIIPFFFTKFMVMRTPSHQEMQSAWASGEILRGEQTPYSKKILPKHFYILQYFPDMVNIESKQFQNCYGVECEYGSTKFLLKLTIKINKFIYIQGVLTGFREKGNSERIMEYTICCINQLLSKIQRQI